MKKQNKYMQSLKAMWTKVSIKFKALSLREFILVIGLLLMGVVFLWNTLIYSSYTNQILEKKDNLLNLTTTLDSKTALVQAIPIEKETLLKTEANIDSILEQFYVKFKDEYLLEDLITLSESSDIDIIELNVPDADNLEEFSGNIYTVEFTILGDKLNIDKYLEDISNIGKYIVLTSYNLTENNTETQMYQAQIQIEVGEILINTELASLEEPLSFLDNLEAMATNPRERYTELEQEYQEELRAETYEKTLSQLYAEDREIYSLGKLSSVKPFVLTGDGINSSIIPSKDHIINQTSYDFKYTIDTNQETLEASIAFNQGFIIKEQHDYISTWIKSKTVTGHEIHLELHDALGEVFDLVVTSGVDWKDWQIKEIDLPIEINYPAKIVRMYVTPSEYKQVQSGELIINGIQVADEKESE